MKKAPETTAQLVQMGFLLGGEKRPRVRFRTLFVSFVEWKLWVLRFAVAENHNSFVHVYVDDRIFSEKSVLEATSHFCNFHRSKSNYLTEITWIVKFEATSISVRSFHMTLSDNYTSPPPTAQFHFIIYWLNVMLQHHSEKIITPDELKCFHSSIAHQGLHFGVSN